MNRRKISAGDSILQKKCLPKTDYEDLKVKKISEDSTLQKKSGIPITEHEDLKVSQILNLISSQLPDPKNFHHRPFNERITVYCHLKPLPSTFENYNRIHDCDLFGLITCPINSLHIDDIDVGLNVLDYLISNTNRRNVIVDKGRSKKIRKFLRINRDISANEYQCNILNRLNEYSDSDKPNQLKLSSQSSSSKTQNQNFSCLIEGSVLNQEKRCCKLPKYNRRWSYLPILGSAEKICGCNFDTRLRAHQHDFNSGLIKFTVKDSNLKKSRSAEYFITHRNVGILEEEYPSHVVEEEDFLLKDQTYSNPRHLGFQDPSDPRSNLFDCLESELLSIDGTMLCERPPELISPPNVIITERKVSTPMLRGDLANSNISVQQCMKVRLVEVRQRMVELWYINGIQW